MGDRLKPGALVRYARNGPAGAMRGCIGQVVAPDKYAATRGWTRVSFSGIIGNYDSQFLERPTYWTSGTYESPRPWPSWKEARLELERAIAARLCVASQCGEKTPALEHDANQALAALASAPETVSGLTVTYASGEYRIQVSGP